MKDLEHVIVAYGNHLGYHHGAKFQILKCWRKWYSRPNVSVCVITDRSDLFESYPIRIVQLTPQQINKWSLEGTQHFGIKLKSLELAMSSGESKKTILLDADTYWVKDPLSIADKIRKKSSVMLLDEGLVHKTKNESINRFNEGLADTKLNIDGLEYQLGPSSRMLNSTIIGMHIDDIEILDLAFKLFTAMEPLVNAHTVEQFSLSEVFRLNQFNVFFGKSLTRDWSSIGRKNYATPVLSDFFQNYGECDFSSHLKRHNVIRIRRPFATLVQQKFARWKEKKNGPR